MQNLSLNELKSVAESRGIKGYKSMSEERLLSALSKSKLVESKSKLIESKNSFVYKRLKKIREDFNKLRDFELRNWEVFKTKSQTN